MICLFWYTEVFKKRYLSALVKVLAKIYWMEIWVNLTFKLMINKYKYLPKNIVWISNWCQETRLVINCMNKFYLILIIICQAEQMATIDKVLKLWWRKEILTSSWTLAVNASCSKNNYKMSLWIRSSLNKKKRRFPQTWKSKRKILTRMLMLPLTSYQRKQVFSLNYSVVVPQQI